MKPLSAALLISGVVAGFLGLTETALADEKTRLTDNHSESKQQIWISLGSDAVETIQSKYQSQLPLKLSSVIGEKADKKIAIAQIPESKIIELSHLMHKEHKRCGGFFYHNSEKDAQAYARRIHQGSEFATVNYTIDNPNAVSALLSQINSNNLTATVNSLSSYYNRYYTSNTGVDAAQWIQSEWQTIVNSRNDIDVQLYSHDSWNQPSVIATITGSTYPDEIVIIGGHLDSINSYDTTGKAPGADDNASGIAVLTESLKAIVNADFQPKRTIKFIGYAAEEVGLRGSQEIASEHKSNNADVIGVVQFDMSGYKGSNKDIVFMTDYTNQEQNQFLADLIDTYISTIDYAYDQCGYGCSDHASWHNQGYAASMPFESYMGQHNSNIHTANDDQFDANHSVNFAKLAVTYLAELAKGSAGNSPDPDPDPEPGNELQNGVPVTGLSATTGNDVVYTMVVPTDATNISFDISGGTGDADLYVRKGATPTDSAYDCRPYKNGNSESCSGNGGGTYYIRVKAYSSFSGVTLVGSYDTGSSPTTPPIDETYSNISVAQGAWEYFSQDLNGDYSSLIVTITGGTGDADLYVRHGSQPTTSSYDCRPYRNGNEETCTIDSPQSGTWHIGLRGYQTSSALSLNIKAEPK